MRLLLLVFAACGSGSSDGSGPDGDVDADADADLDCGGSCAREVSCGRSSSEMCELWCDCFAPLFRIDYATRLFACASDAACDVDCEEEARTGLAPSPAAVDYVAACEEADARLDSAEMSCDIPCGSRSVTLSDEALESLATCLDETECQAFIDCEGAILTGPCGE